MKTISQILGARRGVIIAVSPRETVLHAPQVMAEHDLGALLVMERGKLVGIVSERDYARKVAFHPRSGTGDRCRTEFRHPPA